MSNSDILGNSDLHRANSTRPHRQVYISESQLYHLDAEFLMYSNPSYSMLQNLQSIRQLPFFSRLFRPLNQGSLRQAVLVLMALPVDLGICLAPYCVAQWGLLPGVAMLCLAAVLTQWSVGFMFEAQSHCRDKRPMEVVREFLPVWLSRVFRVSLFIELFATPTLVISFCWELFCFLLCLNNKGDKSWEIELFSLQFNEYDLPVFILRTTYLHFVFLLLLVLFFKSNLGEFGQVSLAHLSLIALLLLTVLTHARSDYTRTHHSADPAQKSQAHWVKLPPELLWARNLFIPLLMYHSHSQAARVRNWVLLPSMRRLRKIVRVSVASQCAFYTLVGCVGYFLWGDRYVPVLVFLREELGVSLLFQLVTIMLVIALLVKVVFLSMGLRDTLIQLSIQSSTCNQAVTTKWQGCCEESRSTKVKTRSILEPTRGPGITRRRLQRSVRELQGEFDQNSLCNDSQKSLQVTENQKDFAVLNQMHYRLKIVHRSKTRTCVSRKLHCLFSVFPIYACFLVAIVFPQIIGGSIP